MANPEPQKTPIDLSLPLQVDVEAIQKQLVERRRTFAALLSELDSKRVPRTTFELQLTGRIAQLEGKLQVSEKEKDEWAKLAELYAQENESLKRQVSELRPYKEIHYRLKRELQIRIGLPRTKPEERYLWRHFEADGMSAN